MKIAKVIGRMTLSKKDASLDGIRLVILSPLEKSDFVDMGKTAKLSSAPNFAACDTLGAGMGDIVGYVDGAEATAQFDHPIPIDACLVAIVEKLNYYPKSK